MWPQQIFSSLLLNFLSKQVCYDGYGCFSNNPPYDISLALLPRDPAYLNTTYYVHTRREPSIQFKAPFKNLSGIVKKKTKTFIVTHGFIEHSRKFWVKPMIEALLGHSDCNVIFVDWEEGADYPFGQAFGDARVIAVEIAKLIEELHRNQIAKVDSIHLIGFSLGAHMMGRVGHLLKNKKLKIDRITGLDPAGPKFEEAHNNVSLDKGDAVFVDVIHSDASTPLLGTLKQQGHVDFYPNGGLLQPGCKRMTTDVFSQKKFMDYVSCSHYRAIEYFIESVNHKYSFKSFKCATYETFQQGGCRDCRNHRRHDVPRCQHMGLHVSRRAKGKYYLLTEKEPPFTGHYYQVKLRTANMPYASFNGLIDFIIYGEKASSIQQTIGRDSHTRNSVATLTFVTKKNLGKIKRLKIKAYTGFWYQDKWFLADVSIRKFGHKNNVWKGCAKRWITDKFQSIVVNGKTCSQQLKRKKVVEHLKSIKS